LNFPRETHVPHPSPSVRSVKSGLGHKLDMSANGAPSSCPQIVSRCHFILERGNIAITSDLSRAGAKQTVALDSASKIGPRYTLGAPIYQVGHAQYALVSCVNRLAFFPQLFHVHLSLEPVEVH
jgi:hypothetical protein